MKKILVLLLILVSTLTQATNLKSVGQTIDDSVITTKIKASFTKEPSLNPFKISVTTQNGAVYLSGFVDDKTAFEKAINIARSTAGVKKVNSNKLTIAKMNSKLTDAYITAKVEATILKEKIVKDESIPLVRIGASTKNGVVTLTGTVKKGASIDTLINAIQQIEGVKYVISKITVSSK